MESTTIKAAAREARGKKAAAKLRATGMLPGIIYGHKEEPRAVALPAHDVELAVTHGVHLLRVELDGRSEQYLLKEVQYDHLGAELIHVDLARVSLDERVRVKVPVELKGTPKGVHEGGILDQMIVDLDVECLVTQIPDQIRVVVNDLGVGQAVHLKDLEPPPGVRALGNPEEIVCMVRMLATAAAAEAPAAEAEAAAEPEVIGRGKEEPQAAEES